MSFYCDNCGEKVERNSSTCPACHVKFKAVKCPSCGYKDEADFFKGGCPSCGYLAQERMRWESNKEKPHKKGFLSIPSPILWTLSFILLITLIVLLRIFF